jgi:eukaryotic translation initiation factor 2C
LKSWEVDVEPKLVQVKARRLQIPEVFAGEKTPLSIRNGSWQAKRLEVPSAHEPLKDWAILLPATLRDTEYRAVLDFRTQLVELLSAKGIPVANSDPPIVDGSNEADIRDKLLKAGKEALGGARGKPPQLVIVVVDKKTSLLHAEIKRISELELGLMTQCIALPNLLKRGNLRSYTENVILKINSKLGGSNTKVAGLGWLQQAPTMIIGADVYHAGPNTKSLSIAAVVGSMDIEFTRFVAAIRPQESRTETITDMKGCVRELLETFRSCTGTSPERIIFFRDGVSEGQYDAVLRTEVQGIKDACEALSIPITVTFIIVTKRHHVRFIPTNPQDGDQKNGNCLPGTTIDYGINHPIRFDYYQYGSQGLLGTSRPAYYTVIFDEHKLGPDQVQDMTLRLCHLYQRANKSISLPAPVQYAHLTAYRARYYVSSAVPTASSSRNSGKEELLPIKPNLKDKMFFS